LFTYKESPSLGCNNVFPTLLDHSHVSPICSLSPPTPKYYLDALVDNFMIYNANVDLSNENNLFSMLNGNVDEYVSLCYFRGYDPFSTLIVYA